VTALGGETIGRGGSSILVVYQKGCEILWIGSPNHRTKSTAGAAPFSAKCPESRHGRGAGRRGEGKAGENIPLAGGWERSEKGNENGTGAHHRLSLGLRENLSSA